MATVTKDPNDNSRTRLLAATIDLTGDALPVD